MFGRIGDYHEPIQQEIRMEARLDKWLWAARIFKTRTIAADACKKGRVMISGVQQKPSKMIKEGEVYSE